MIPIPLFVGFDPREESGLHAFVSSVIAHASEPVSITPLSLKSLSVAYDNGLSRGSNAFTQSRFLIPWLMGYRGHAIFADGCDMICRGDIAELWALRSPWKAVQCVKHDYKTRHPVKYVGTEMESRNVDYPRKNWASLMLINCAHFGWRNITPDTVEKHGAELVRMSQFEDRFVGELPPEWNWLVDEFGESSKAKLLHWTAGIPAFEHYANAPSADEWRANANRAAGVA